MNEYWVFTELSPGRYSARATKNNVLCYPETRLYFSRESLERDFGKVDNEEIQRIENR